MAQTLRCAQLAACSLALPAVVPPCTTLPRLACRIFPLGGCAHPRLPGPPAAGAAKHSLPLPRSSTPQGIFSFNLTLAEIKTLFAIQRVAIRDQSFNGGQAAPLLPGASRTWAAWCRQQLPTAADRLRGTDLPHLATTSPQLPTACTSVPVGQRGASNRHQRGAPTPAG